MEKYFEIRNQLKTIQNELGLQLEKILEEYGYDRSFAWFNFNQDRFIIIWGADYIPMDVLKALEEEFGEIKDVRTTQMSSKLQVYYKKDGEE